MPDRSPNVPPDNFWVVGNPVLNIYENEANGTVVGSLMASDPDANASLRFLLSDDANGSFSMDESGLIESRAMFDYETGPQVRPIGLIVFDQHNASLEGTVEIEILNVVEDLDGDGIEDYYDLDDDGDGFPDLVEIAYPSDPRDADSWANTPPNPPAHRILHWWMRIFPQVRGWLSFSALILMGTICRLWFWIRETHKGPNFSKLIDLGY